MEAKITSAYGHCASEFVYDESLCQLVFEGVFLMVFGRRLVETATAMYNGKKILAVVPARGGSKGIPRKNIHLVAGKPLIAWTIEAALACPAIDRVIVTTDDAEIAEVSRRFGAEIPFMRPAELASDTASGVAPLEHALSKIPGFDYAVLLQPTSPLRLPEHILGCIELCLNAGANSAVSVTDVTVPPAHMFSLDSGSRLTALQPELLQHRRQDLPPLVALNGAVYVVSIPWFLAGRRYIDAATLGYAMPKAFALDVDEPADLAIAEALLLRR